MLPREEALQPPAWFQESLLSCQHCLPSFRSHCQIQRQKKTPIHSLSLCSKGIRHCLAWWTRLWPARPWGRGRHMAPATEPLHRYCLCRQMAWQTIQLAAWATGSRNLKRSFHRKGEPSSLHPRPKLPRNEHWNHLSISPSLCWRHCPAFWVTHRPPEHDQPGRRLSEALQIPTQPKAPQWLWDLRQIQRHGIHLKERGHSAKKYSPLASRNVTLGWYAAPQAPRNSQ